MEDFTLDTALLSVSSVVRPRRGVSFCEMLEALAVEILEEELKKKVEAPKATRAAPAPQVPLQSVQASGVVPGRAAKQLQVGVCGGLGVPDSTGGRAADGLQAAAAAAAPAAAWAAEAAASCRDEPLQVSVSLVSGATVLRSVGLEPESTLAELFSRAELALGKQLHALTGPGGRCMDREDVVKTSGLRSGDVVVALFAPPVRVFSTSAAFAAVKADGSVVTWGDMRCGGDSSIVRDRLARDVVHVYSNERAFAALKRGGAVVTWDDSAYGGDSSSVQEQLASDVRHICATRSAFAALRSNGSVVTWGGMGGDSSHLRWQLAYDVQSLCATKSAFAAIKGDGSVVTWGSENDGGDCSGVQDELIDGVVRVYSTDAAFAAVKGDGSVVTWGRGACGGDSSGVEQSLAREVVLVCATGTAFSALKAQGCVVTWGHGPSGGDSSGVQAQLAGGVRCLYSTRGAFAALKDNGSVVTWGYTSYGGSSSSLRQASDGLQSMGPIPEEHSSDHMAVSVREQLAGGVEHIVCSDAAFAAVKADGSVVAWGDSASGGDCSKVEKELRGVRSVHSSLHAFAALRQDGSVVTWGGQDYGGDSSGVQRQLANDVECIPSTWYAFAAVKSSGEVVTWGHALRGGEPMPSPAPSPVTTPSRTPVAQRQPRSLAALQQHPERAATPPRRLSGASTPPQSHRRLDGGALPPQLPTMRQDASHPTLPRGAGARPEAAAAPVRSPSEGSLTLPPLRRDASAPPSQRADAVQARSGRGATSSQPSRRPQRQSDAPRQPEAPASNDDFWATFQASLGKEAKAPAQPEARPAPRHRLASSSLGRKSTRRL